MWLNKSSEKIYISREGYETVYGHDTSCCSISSFYFNFYCFYVARNWYLAFTETCIDLCFGVLNFFLILSLESVRKFVDFMRTCIEFKCLLTKNAAHFCRPCVTTFHKCVLYSTLDILFYLLFCLLLLSNWWWNSLHAPFLYCSTVFIDGVGWGLINDARLLLSGHPLGVLGLQCSLCDLCSQLHSCTQW